MVTITERAKERLRQLLLERVESGSCLRLEAGGLGLLGLVADRARPGDHVVEHQGATVLVIGPALAERLEGCRIDWTAGAPDATLRVTRERVGTNGSGSR